MLRNVELGSAQGRGMGAGLTLAATEADATSQACLKPGCPLQRLQRPPPLLQDPCRPTEVEGGRLGNRHLVWGFGGFPVCPQGTHRRPHSSPFQKQKSPPLPGAQPSPPLTHLPQYTWGPLLPWGPEPEPAEGVSLRACPGPYPPKKA